MQYNIEPITGDNRRPGMSADHTHLVRHTQHPSYGWLCYRTFKTREEAEAFAATLKPVDLPSVLKTTARKLVITVVIEDEETLDAYYDVDPSCIEQDIRHGTLLEMCTDMTVTKGCL